MGGYTRKILALMASFLLVITLADCVIYNTSTYSEMFKSGYRSPLLRTVQANEILEKIEAGQSIEYNKVLIKGDLDLGHLNLTKSTLEPLSIRYYLNGEDSNYTLSLIYSRISIRDSKIDGNLSFKDAVFMNVIDFEHTDFNGTADYTGSIFIDDSYFRYCRFKGLFNGDYDQFRKECYFSNSVFEEDAAFTRTEFSGDATFNGTCFNQNADFWGSNFHGMANFLFCDFIMNARFSDVQFSKDVNFNDYDSGGTIIWDSDGSIFGTTNGNFKADADFSNSDFRGNANFYGIWFFRYSNFYAAHFAKDANFAGAIFEYYAHFNRAKFDKGADFSRCSFNGDTDFNGANFQGFIDLSYIKFINKIDIYWPKSVRLICNDGPTYLNLIKNFRDLERFESADSIYYQYRQWRQDQTSWIDGNKYLDILALLTCGYGVRPQYPIYWSGILIIAFSLIYWNWGGIQKQDKQCYRVTYATEYKKSQSSFSFNKFFFNILNLFHNKSTTNAGLSFIDAIYFSSMIFLVSHPPTDWRPSDSWKWWKFLIMIEDIIGWLLMTLFVVTLTHVMIRP
jgi:hypothetical protein